MLTQHSSIKLKYRLLFVHSCYWKKLYLSFFFQSNDCVSSWINCFSTLKNIQPKTKLHFHHSSDFIFSIACLLLFIIFIDYPGIYVIEMIVYADIIWIEFFFPFAKIKRRWWWKGGRGYGTGPSGLIKWYVYMINKINAE